MQRKLLLLGSVLVLATGLWMLSRRPRSGPEWAVKTVCLAKGTVVNTVSATGTLEPIDQVEVGTQVSGVIEKIYVDFNDVVKRGQVLAELDKNALEARLLQAKASLASAENELHYQEKIYHRSMHLYQAALLSESDFEVAVYQFKNAQLAVDRLLSEVDQAQINLNYSTIYSPIDGVVLERAVEEGQTVAASFNTPTLFTIARDLTQMQVEAAVDEADIGQVAQGQRVSFVVDAFPDEVFGGTITQIRLNPVIASNVVTYTVIVDAPNPDLLLKPGLTATISIVTREARDVAVLPFSALNIQPAPLLEGAFDLKMAQEIKNQKAGSGPSSWVWVKKGEVLLQVPVVTGLSDRVLIQVLSGVNPVDSVVIGFNSLQEPVPDVPANSPFVPAPPRGGN